MESEQLYSRGYCRTGYSSYNSITSASSDEELLDSAGATMDFHTTEDDNLLDGDAASSPVPSAVLLRRVLRISVIARVRSMHAPASLRRAAHISP
ncbi:unnamed protein product [Boreogadus saida]